MCTCTCGPVELPAPGAPAAPPVYPKSSPAFADLFPPLYA